MKKTAEDAAPRPSVSVVVPALNEADTVAAVIDSVRPSLDAGIVDEIIVVDSDSTDATAEIAAAAGARVVNWRDVLPDVEPRRGKGEALWRGVAAARGDVVVFLDADVRDPSPAVVPTLIAPLLSDESVRLVKGHYRRDHPTDVGGGRVTELTARPLLAAFRPDLAVLRQPLAGEYAARREDLRALPFAARYGVEIGLLVDVADTWGADSIVEADLGTRRHRNRPLSQLAPMAVEVSATLLRKLGLDPATGHDLPEDRPPLSAPTPDGVWA
ncbi:glucosyl-3-phosphoglycerate synthase [uncultured Corynebacterium sp.]|uniref:glucosyl-3-phosphoglycerate synthase n=1 Tax=uncultured Corynebacterium sp. TaxID=159447 RepID=UPI0025DA804D|nr:glucosyl-3-phosphoglycerate synthase [uncultured Corynebacterium sp.]